MTIKISKSLLKVGLLTLITVPSVSATNIKTQDKELAQPNYHHMSTIELQKEVEKRSINGTLPFQMGIAFIKRWSDSQ